MRSASQDLESYIRNNASAGPAKTLNTQIAGYSVYQSETKPSITGWSAPTLTGRSPDLTSYQDVQSRHRAHIANLSRIASNTSSGLQSSDGSATASNWSGDSQGGGSSGDDGNLDYSLTPRAMSLKKRRRRRQRRRQQLEDSDLNESVISNPEWTGELALVAPVSKSTLFNRKNELLSKIEGATKPILPSSIQHFSTIDPRGSLKASLLEARVMTGITEDNKRLSRPNLSPTSSKTWSPLTNGPGSPSTPSRRTFPFGQSLDELTVGTSALSLDEVGQGIIPLQKTGLRLGSPIANHHLQRMQRQRIAAVTPGSLSFNTETVPPSPSTMQSMITPSLPATSPSEKSFATGTAGESVSGRALTLMTSPSQLASPSFSAHGVPTASVVSTDRPMTLMTSPSQLPSPIDSAQGGLTSTDRPMTLLTLPSQLPSPNDSAQSRLDSTDRISSVSSNSKRRENADKSHIHGLFAKLEDINKQTIDEELQQYLSERKNSSFTCSTEDKLNLNVKNQEIAGRAEEQQVFVPTIHSLGDSQNLQLNEDSLRDVQSEFFKGVSNTHEEFDQDLPNSAEEFQLPEWEDLDKNNEGILSIPKKVALEKSKDFLPLKMDFVNPSKTNANEGHEKVESAQMTYSINQRRQSETNGLEHRQVYEPAFTLKRSERDSFHPEEEIEHDFSRRTDSGEKDAPEVAASSRKTFHQVARSLAIDDTDDNENLKPVSSISNPEIETTSLSDKSKNQEVLSRLQSQEMLLESLSGQVSSLVELFGQMSHQNDVGDPGNAIRQESFEEKENMGHSNPTNIYKTVDAAKGLLDDEKVNTSQLDKKQRGKTIDAEIKPIYRDAGKQLNGSLSTGSDNVQHQDTAWVMGINSQNRDREKVTRMKFLDEGSDYESYLEYEALNPHFSQTERVKGLHTITFPNSGDLPRCGGETNLKKKGIDPVSPPEVFEQQLMDVYYARRSKGPKSVRAISLRELIQKGHASNSGDMTSSGSNKNPTEKEIGSDRSAESTILEACVCGNRGKTGSRARSTQRKPASLGDFLGVKTSKNRIPKKASPAEELLSTSDEDRSDKRLSKREAPQPNKGQPNTSIGSSQLSESTIYHSGSSDNHVIASPDISFQDSDRTEDENHIQQKRPNLSELLESMQIGPAHSHSVGSYPLNIKLADQGKKADASDKWDMPLPFLQSNMVPSAPFPAQTFPNSREKVTFPQEQPSVNVESASHKLPEQDTIDQPYSLSASKKPHKGELSQTRQYGGKFHRGRSDVLTLHNHGQNQNYFDGTAPYTHSSASDAQSTGKNLKSCKYSELPAQTETDGADKRNANSQPAISPSTEKSKVLLNSESKSIAPQNSPLHFQTKLYDLNAESPSPLHGESILANKKSESPVTKIMQSKDKQHLSHPQHLLYPREINFDIPDNRKLGFSDSSVSFKVSEALFGLDSSQDFQKKKDFKVEGGGSTDQKKPNFVLQIDDEDMSIATSEETPQSRSNIKDEGKTELLINKTQSLTNVTSVETTYSESLSGVPNLEEELLLLDHYKHSQDQSSSDTIFQKRDDEEYYLQQEINRKLIDSMKRMASFKSSGESDVIEDTDKKQNVSLGEEERFSQTNDHAKSKDPDHSVHNGVAGRSARENSQGQGAAVGHPNYDGHNVEAENHFLTDTCMMGNPDKENGGVSATSFKSMTDDSLEQELKEMREIQQRAEKLFEFEGEGISEGSEKGSSDIEKNQESASVQKDCDKADRVGTKLGLDALLQELELSTETHLPGKHFPFNHFEDDDNENQDPSQMTANEDVGNFISPSVSDKELELKELFESFQRRPKEESFSFNKPDLEVNFKVNSSEKAKIHTQKQVSFADGIELFEDRKIQKPPRIPDIHIGSGAFLNERRISVDQKGRVEDDHNDDGSLTLSHVVRSLDDVAQLMNRNVGEDTSEGYKSARNNHGISWHKEMHNHEILKQSYTLI